MMKTSALLIIFILLLGCATEIGDRSGRKDEKSHDMWFSRSLADTPGEVTIRAHVKIPHKYLVFQKIDEQFSASIEISLTIVDRTDDHQVLNKTWNDEILLDKYEDTRKRGMFYISQTQFVIPDGEYTVSALIVDNDSKHRWRLKKDITFDALEFWTDIVPYIRVNNELLDMGSRIAETDSVFCRFRTVEREILDNLVVHYSIIQDDSTLSIDSQIARFIPESGDYEVIVPLDENIS